MIRVYVNHPRALEPWSVDRGTIATEQKFLDIAIEGYAETRCDITANNETEPQCWLEVYGKVYGKAVGTDLVTVIGD